MIEYLSNRYNASICEAACSFFFPYERYDVKSAQGILIPGGFGARATEGMFKAAEYARTQRVPYLGICMGL